MTKIVHIKHETEKAVLSKAQKKFNSLIKKIDAQKKILVNWKNSTSKFHNVFMVNINHYLIHLIKRVLKWYIYLTEHMTIVSLKD